MSSLYHNTPQTEQAKIDNRVTALEHRRDVPGFYEIKIIADDDEVATGDGLFIFAIPIDLDRSKLRYVNAFVTTVSSSGLVTVQIHNLTASSNEASNFDMLLTPITIDANEFDAENATTPWEIDKGFNEYGWPDTDNTVYYRQQLRIDVDTAGTGAMGLGVMLGFE